VNLAQIHSAIPEIFDLQINKHTKKSQTVIKTEPYAVHCVWQLGGAYNSTDDIQVLQQY